MLSSGREDLLLFVGARGVGKSSLLESIAAEAGANVVRFSAQEATWSYSGLSAIAAGLGGWRADAIDGALQHARGASATEFDVGVELSRSLRMAPEPEPEPEPLLLDSIDNLDPASASVLAFLCARRQATGLRVVATATELPADGPFGWLEQTRLEPLDRTVSMRLAASRRLGPADRGVLSIVAIMSGGNPGAIMGAKLTAREWRGLDAVRIPLRVGEDTTGAWGDADSRSSVRADLLRMCALAPASMGAALEGGSVDRQDALEDLLEEGLVESIEDVLRIADRQLRSGIYSSMNAHERRAMHAAAAELHDGVDPRISLWHRSFLHPPDDAELSLLLVAASFVRADAIEVAVEFAERALSMSAGLPERGELLLDLAEELIRKGEFTLAQHYLSRISGADGRVALAVRRAHATLMVEFALEPHVSERAVDSFLSARVSGEPGACASLLLALARLHLLRWDVPRAKVALRRARMLTGTARGLPFRLMAETLLPEERVEASPLSPIDEAVRDVHQLQSADAIVLVQTLVMAGRCAEARSVSAALLDRGPPLSSPQLASVLGLLVLLEVREARKEPVRDAVAAWRGVLLPESTVDAVRCLIEAGAESLLNPEPSARVDELIETTRSRCGLEHNAVVSRHLAVLEGGRALARGQYEEATRLLAGAVVPGEAQDPAVLRADADLIEALCLDGRFEDARARLAEFSGRVERWPGAWSSAALTRARAVCEDGAPSATPTVSSSPVLDLLDSHELEVASLVQSGLRNREIATALFVSQRTVELRLTRIYRKLAIDSRAHLVALMSALH